MGYEQGLARRFLEMGRDKAAYGAPHAAHRTPEEGINRSGCAVGAGHGCYNVIRAQGERPVD
jgi:hypothetical protein